MAPLVIQFLVEGSFVQWLQWCQWWVRNRLMGLERLLDKDAWLSVASWSGISPAYLGRSMEKPPVSFSGRITLEPRRECALPTVHAWPPFLPLPHPSLVLQCRPAPGPSHCCPSLSQPLTSACSCHQNQFSSLLQFTFSTGFWLKVLHEVSPTSWLEPINLALDSLALQIHFYYYFFNLKLLI